MYIVFNNDNEHPFLISDFSIEYIDSSCHIINSEDERWTREQIEYIKNLKSVDSLTLINNGQEIHTYTNLSGSVKDVGTFSNNYSGVFRIMDKVSIEF